MIEQVTNFNLKSFKNYTGPITKFVQANIIFGYNGRGKSTLAEGIVNEFLKVNGNERNKYRFFNRNYITKNLMIEQSKDSKIKGIIANFGQKDIEIEKQIKELENKIVNTQSLKSQIISINESIRNEMDKIHDTKKGSTSITKKAKNKTNEEIIKLYKEDIKSAIKIEADEEKLINIKGDNSLEIEKSKIEKIVIPIISVIKKSEIDEVGEIFKRTFDNIEIPSSRIVSWIEEGTLIHEEGEKCKFCGGRLDLEKIKEKVEDYNKDEKQKNSIKLINFNEKLTEVIKQIDNLFLLKENIIVNLENDVKQQFDILEEKLNELREFSGNIHKKIENMEKNISFDENILVTIFYEIENAYKVIVSEKERMINILNDKISKLSILIKGAIGLEICRNTFIISNLETVKIKENEMKKIERQNNDNLRKIEELKNSKSNTKDFADHISEILSMIEVNLKLEVIDDDYVIKQSATNDILRLEDISEGEQNLLALLYFYYELFEDKEQKKLKNDIKLIVIDDPISSLDDVNRMYILELVKKISNLSDIQIFIFSHVWEDFCNICYGKDNKDNYNFYEIKKNSTGSFIESAKTNETPYKHNFKEIYDFSQKSDSSNMTDCEIYHYPNIMRKILEEFLEFKVKNSSPTSANINNIRMALCGENPSSRDELRLGTLLNVCNILSHNASRNPDEILKSAKFLMNKIQKVDELHFNTMKQ